MNPYVRLGVSPEDPPEKIEARYRQLLRAYHPDFHQGAGADALAQAERATRDLNETMAAIRRDQVQRATAAGQAARAAEAEAEHRSATAERAAADPATGTGTPWWDEPVAPSADCPLCGETCADLEAYDLHMKQAHQIKVFIERRKGWGITLSRTARDVLAVIGMLLGTALVLWLTTWVRINPIMYFLIWLGVISLFLPTLLMRNKGGR